MKEEFNPNAFLDDPRTEDEKEEEELSIFATPQEELTEQIYLNLLDKPKAIKIKEEILKGVYKK